MQTDFSDRTETELVAARAVLLKMAQPGELECLEAEASNRLNAFLDGTTVPEVSEAPAFFSFIKVFGETENPGLKMLTKKAEVKVIPVLKEFDRIAGYEDLGKITAEEIGRNIAVLDRFDETDPFERGADGEMVYPQFEKIEKLTDVVEILDDDGTPSADAADMLKSTILEAAKLKTYMRLCVSFDEITRRAYLEALQSEMELALVTLFLMDKSVADYPLGKQEAQKLHEEFKKLINTLEQVAND